MRLLLCKFDIIALDYKKVRNTHGRCFKQRAVADEIERIVAENSLVAMPHEALVLIDVDKIAAYMLTDDSTLINSDEQFSLDFSFEDLEKILNDISSEHIYTYSSDTSRLVLSRDVTKISDESYELKFFYRLELRGNDLCICEDGSHYIIDEGESPLTTREIIDRIADTLDISVFELADNIVDSPLRLRMLSEDLIGLRDESDIYEVFEAEAPLEDLWLDLIYVSNIRNYSGQVFEKAQSFVIDVSEFK